MRRALALTLAVLHACLHQSQASCRATKEASSGQDEMIARSSEFTTMLLLLIKLLSSVSGGSLDRSRLEKVSHGGFGGPLWLQRCLHSGLQ